jgi:hypothetical protein
MAKSKPDDRQVERHKIAGHSVEIRKRDDREELWIDGVRKRFFVTDSGYRLNDNAYAPPTRTLLEAVEGLLKKPER